MPRWDDGDLEDAAAADDEFDPDDDDDDPTMPCPHCRREIFEDAERCPYCAAYITREDAPAGPRPWWLVLGVVACLYAVYRWTVGR